MYTSFYNMDSRPFETHLDPSFLWPGEKHNEALTVLRDGIRENKGFLLLTGDAGVGKTMLINVLTATLGLDVAWAVIGDPSLSRLDFYNAIIRGFKIDRECTSKVQFLLQFSNFLHKAHDENKKVLLLIDNCHLLSQDLLEELRLLANIEKEEEKLIHIVFVGRREFHDMLVQPINRAVRQCLTLEVELAALTLNETEDYIRHRLNIAGADEKMFTAKAIRIIHRGAGGIPRLINKICNCAMVAGSVQGKPTLD
ncbi:MAG: ExeA2, partial [uncultured bacterium]